MNLSFRPMAWIKTLAVSASVVTMCISPVALGAEAQNQKQMVNEFLKATGLGKDITVGEYWQKVRHVYPESMRKDIDIWVSLNRNELMPKVEVNTYKDRDGQEQLRISLSKDGQVVTLTNTGEDDKNIKINNISFSKDQVFNHRLVAKTLAEKDPTVKKALKTGRLPVLGKKIVMTYKEYARLNPRQKAEYLVRLRSTMEAAQRVYKSVYGQQAMNDFDQQHQYAANWAAGLIFGSEANAAGLTGKPCIVAGYLSVYGENQSCGGSKTGADDLARKMSEGSATCTNNAVACNPMVYGFDSGGGAYCVPRAEIKYATRVCNQKSPLRKDNPKSEGEDKKRIIESYLKKVKGQDINLVLNEEGKISQEQFNQISAYLGDLQQYIDSAIAECDSLPLAAIQKTRPDQVSACNEIRIRAFSLQSFIANPQPGPTPQPPPVPQVPVRDCELELMGSALSEDGKSCVCPANSKPGKVSSTPPEAGKKGDEEIAGQDRQACIHPGIVVADDDSGLAGAKPSPIKGEDSCGFWCRNKNWIIGGGVFLGILALLALFMKKKKPKTPTYVPPVPVVPTPTATPTVPPAPTLPPAPTCNAPNTWVGGVCTPPVITLIPTPPPVPSEGGTKPDTNQGGGVR